jgi:hypothetical protein
VKILVAGDWHSELHEAAAAQGLAALGHDVVRFAWHAYFKGGVSPLGVAWRKAQNKYLLGPLVTRLNADLLARVRQERPDVLFVYRGTHVLPATLRAIRDASPDTRLVGYNNDDPFSPHYPRWLWRHFVAGIREYDLVLAYRQQNVADFQAAGARRVELLRSWYMTERNHPVALSEAEREAYGADVVFVGHYEDDGRAEMLEEVVRQGWKLRLWGHGYSWGPVIARSPELRRQGPLSLVWGDEYNKALCGAKVALCFLSKLNRDTYTRRCFEIPATGTLLLSERTEDLEQLFRPGVEADFFSSKDEMIAKLRLYLGDDERRRRVAAAGLKRVHDDGHDVVSRMRELLGWVTLLPGATCV